MQTDMPRRAFIGTSAAAVAAVSLSGQATAAPEADSAIRPFTVAVPQGQLNDLRRRLNATRWPFKETVQDQSLRGMGGAGAVQQGDPGPRSVHFERSRVVPYLRPSDAMNSTRKSRVDSEAQMSVTAGSSSARNDSMRCTAGC